VKSAFCIVGIAALELTGAGSIPSPTSRSPNAPRPAARRPGFSSCSRHQAGSGVALTLEYKGYIGTVEAEEGVFFGRVAGLRDVITFQGTTFAEVEQAFRDSIDDYLAFCGERGEPPDRPYSGKIPLRVSPDIHRRAVMRAQSEGLSLNQWIARRIESAG